jgi:hypothetical protein
MPHLTPDMLRECRQLRDFRVWTYSSLPRLRQETTGGIEGVSDLPGIHLSDSAHIQGVNLLFGQKAKVTWAPITKCQLEYNTYLSLKVILAKRAYLPL